MTNPLFSERYGFAPPPEPKSHDHLPPWVREDIVNKMRKFVDANFSLTGFDMEIYQIVRPYIWQVLQKSPPQQPMGGPWSYYIPTTLMQCSWWQFYDILEEIAQTYQVKSKVKILDELAKTINTSLAKESIPWKMENGKIVHAFNEQIQSKIKEVHALLTNPNFKGPDEQFGKAIESLNRRPEPDEENCVKDAIGAIEAVANILSGTTGKQLNILLNQEPYKSGIPATIRQSIEKIYAYRGATPGVGHGQVGPSTVRIEEAKWVLTASTATILYLVAKFYNEPKSF